MVLFRENLQRLRKELTLTQESMADKIGISRNYYRAIEKGASDPSLKIIYTIAITFKLSLNWLVLGVGSKYLHDDDVIVG